MSIEFKLATQGDEALLANAAADVFDDPIDPDAAREFLSDARHHMAIAIDVGVVVGFISAVVYVHPDKRRPELWINEVGVAPTHQRRGIARRLMRAVLEVGRDLDCGEAWVLTDRKNHPAMELYASAGGVPTPDDQVMFTFVLEPGRSR